MNISLLPFTVLWMILAAAVVGLIAYRKWVARDEDDSLHVMDAEFGLAHRQEVVGRKLESIDRWGKSLTALALVYGVLVGAAYLYKNWVSVSTEIWK